MKKINLSVIALLSSLSIVNASPIQVEVYSENAIILEKEDRKGFRLGFGLGLGENTIKSSYGSYEDTGVATSFEIGYAFTNQISLNYVRNANWFSAETYPGFEESYVGGFGGIVGNYYFKDEKDTPYVVAGVGLVDFTNMSQGSSDVGTGYMFGIGYAFDHVEVELNYNGGTVQGDYVDYDQSSLQLTVSYMFF